MLSNSRTARRLYNRKRRFSADQWAVYNDIVARDPTRPGLKVAAAKYALHEPLRQYEQVMLRALGVSV